MIANTDDLRDTLARREQIKRSVRMLCDAFARKLNEDALDTWAERLEPYATNPLLWRVLKDAVAWENWPNLGVLLGKIQSEIKHSEGTKPPPPMTERERQRSDTAAIYSMLWLVYEKRWRVEDFAGTALARAFGRDPAEALRVAMMQFDRETVANWMEKNQ